MADELRVHVSALPAHAAIFDEVVITRDLAVNSLNACNLSSQRIELAAAHLLQG